MAQSYIITLDSADLSLQAQPTSIGRPLPAVVTDTNGNPYSLTVAADGSISVAPYSGAAPNADQAIQFTAASLIASALRLINVVAAGEITPIDAANDSLLVLNQMIDSWNAESQVIFSTRYDDYPLIAGQQTYTLGPGGDFNANRPAKIAGMSSILLNNPANPLEVPITMYSVQDWQRQVPVKSVSSSFPQICYDDGGFPLRTLNLWPYPAFAENNLRIYSWQSIGWPSTLRSLISFPPGYAEALRYNLALRLAPEFAAQVPPMVAQLAVESLARIKRMNVPDMEMRSDLLATDAGYNYKADLFGIGL